MNKPELLKYVLQAKQFLNECEDDEHAKLAVLIRIATAVEGLNQNLKAIRIMAEKDAKAES